MLFENDDYDYAYDVLSLAGFNYSPNYYEYEKKDVLTSPTEGFLKGNMWKNEYNAYKNYEPVKLKPTCEQEYLLYKIMELDFAINDLNLYLDLHPEDSMIYEKFKMYTKECMNLKDEYAKKYGPLTLNDVYTSEYAWMKNPWPWEKFGGSMYV